MNKLVLEVCKSWKGFKTELCYMGLSHAQIELLATEGAPIKIEWEAKTKCGLSTKPTTTFAQYSQGVYKECGRVKHNCWAWKH